MLKHIHVLLYVSVSSNSWERESFIHEFPGVDCEVGFLARLFTNSFLEIQYIGPMSGVKSSGEHINLIIDFGLSLIEINTIRFGGINLK